MSEDILHPVVDRFLSYIQLEKRYSPHTFAAYRQDLHQFFQFLEKQYGQLELPAIGHLHIRSWLAELIQEQQQPRTVNRKISALKSFFKYTVRQGLILQTPMVKVSAPKVSRRLPGFIDEKGMQAMEDNRSMRRGEEDTPIFSEDLQGVTHRLVFDLLYHTGIRLSELINLEERNVDSGNLTIKVLGKGN
ncbi:MAG TPA: site-specific integrase, partial [Chitinophaga sp.]